MNTNPSTQRQAPASHPPFPRFSRQRHSWKARNHAKSRLVTHRCRNLRATGLERKVVERLQNVKRGESLGSERRLLGISESPEVVPMKERWARRSSTLGGAKFAAPECEGSQGEGRKECPMLGFGNGGDLAADFAAEVGAGAEVKVPEAVHEVLGLLFDGVGEAAGVVLEGEAGAEVTVFDRLADESRVIRKEEVNAIPFRARNAGGTAHLEQSGFADEVGEAVIGAPADVDFEGIALGIESDATEEGVAGVQFTTSAGGSNEILGVAGVHARAGGISRAKVEFE